MMNILMMSAFQNIKMYSSAIMLLWIATLHATNTNTPVDSVRTNTPFERYKNLLLDYDFDCDVCGCSGNGGSMGYGSATNGNFAGVRYLYQHYRSKDGIFNNSPYINENFNTVQLWGKIPVNNKLTASILVPYHYHNREFTDGSTQDIKGLGDITLMGFYKLIKPKTDSVTPLNDNKWNHTLSIGGGIKVPTGTYDNTNNEGSVNPGFQVGTGSWDYILGVEYTITKNNWGTAVTINYNFKTENDQHYQFGNQLNYGLNAYRTIGVTSSLVLIPFAGISGEHFEVNKQYNQDVTNTGGSVFFSKFGLETAYTNWALGVNAMLPISQNLNNGMVKVKYRMGMYLNYNL